ncbi:MAG: hypothetical protein Ct9H300mP28_29880 [Pseudomonadota bacterium]|nr:MAG: hypothetical protein Ct9H300mP28_29880 [Pseudomonadota bacterium]
MALLLYDDLFLYERDVQQHLFVFGKFYPIEMWIQVSKMSGSF